MINKLTFASYFLPIIPFILWEYAFNQEASMNELLKATFIWAIICFILAIFL